MLTVEKVVEAYHVLTSLIQSDKQNKFVLSSATRITLAGNLRRVKDVYNDYEAERQELVKRLAGEPDPKTGNVTVDPKNNEEFQKELKKALAEPTDIVLKAITPEQLYGATEEEEKKGKKPNQIDIDLHAFLEEVGLLTS